MPRANDICGLPIPRTPHSFLWSGLAPLAHRLLVCRCVLVARSHGTFFSSFIVQCNSVFVVYSSMFFSALFNFFFNRVNFIYVIVWVFSG